VLHVDCVGKYSLFEVLQYNCWFGFIVFDFPGVGSSAIFRQLVVVILTVFILGVSDYGRDEPWDSLDGRPVR
jgi:hypothetical protein